MDSPVEISVIIPAYNEELRLPNYLNDWLNFLPQHFSRYEIIVSDDGSSDGLVVGLKCHPEYQRHLWVVENCHEGKGATVRAGMLRARGRLRLFADADGATPVGELLALRQRLEGVEPGVAIGSRVALEGATKVERKLLRHYLGRIFATITSLISGLTVYDTQCGFKLFTAATTQVLFSPLFTKGFAFDVEILMRARRLEIPVYEVPITWRDQKGSKVCLSRDALKMLWEVWRIRRCLV